MGDKSCVTGSKMSVVENITEPMFFGRTAKKMSQDLLHKFDGGPGDTLDATAFRIQSQYGVDANILMQGWNRPARPMMAHRWLPLFRAWCAAGFARVDAAYEEERKRHDDTSALVRLADLVAGKKDQGSSESRS